MIRVFAICLLLSAFCFSMRGVLVIPTQSQMDATNNWPSLATYLNASGLVTNPPGYADRGGYGYIMRTTEGSTGFLCAIGSNKVVWASHIGIGGSATIRYESDKGASPVIYTITSTASSGDCSISTVTPNLSLWAAVDTNYVAGDTYAISWGSGQTYNTNGTVTTNSSIRRFPLNSGSAGYLRHAPCFLYAAWFGGAEGYRIYGNLPPEAGIAVCIGDSSGPTFTTNGAVKFIGTFQESATAETYHDESGAAHINAAWSNTGFIVGQLGDDLNGGTNIVSSATSTIPAIRTGTFRIR